MRIRLCGGGALVLILLVALSGTPAAAQNPHVGHVATSFGRAPDGRGLAATAAAEWGTAMLHANFAAGDLSDVAAMHRHAGHVLHALDPAEGSRGPGLGFGLIPAIAGVATHIGLAANSDGASEGVRTHAQHITAIAGTVARRAEEAAAVAAALQAAPSMRRAAPLVAKLRLLMYQIGEGGDEDGDGRLALDGEAGLQQLEAHIYLLLEAERLPRIIR